MRSYVYLAAAAATLSVATPALAGPYTVTADAKGTVLQSLTLVNKADLDFGTVAPDFLVADTVSVDADSGARTTAASKVVLLPGTFSRGIFEGAGTPGNTAQISLTQPAGGVISNGTQTVAATLKLDAASAAPTVTIPVGGKFTVYVGGDFVIGANQASGLYVGQFDVTANYQ